MCNSLGNSGTVSHEIYKRYRYNTEIFLENAKNDLKKILKLRRAEQLTPYKVNTGHTPVRLPRGATAKPRPDPAALRLHAGQTPDAEPPHLLPRVFPEGHPKARLAAGQIPGAGLQRPAPVGPRIRVHLLLPQSLRGELLALMGISGYYRLTEGIRAVFFFL